ncbi:MAG: hypothetical protein RIC12_00920, partial [Pirellulales bacterium]
DQRLSIYNLRNDNSSGAADAAVVNFGPAKALLGGGLGWTPIVGDWDGNSIPFAIRLETNVDQTDFADIETAQFQTDGMAWTSMVNKEASLFTSASAVIGHGFSLKAVDFKSRNETQPPIVQSLTITRESLLPWVVDQAHSDGLEPAASNSRESENCEIDMLTGTAIDKGKPSTDITKKI